MLTGAGVPYKPPLIHSNPHWGLIVVLSMCTKIEDLQRISQTTFVGVYMKDEVKEDVVPHAPKQNSHRTELQQHLWLWPLSCGDTSSAFLVLWYVVMDQISIPYRCRWNTWRESECPGLVPPLLCIFPDIVGTWSVQSSAHCALSLVDELQKIEKKLKRHIRY